MRKNSAAVALGRKGGRKGGIARAARLTPAQRSASAANAVRARWAKNAGAAVVPTTADKAPAQTDDTSDLALALLLARLRTTSDIGEVRQLSEQIERVVFHKQFESA